MDNPILDNNLLEQEKIYYAGFWYRLGALILDGIVLIIFFNFFRDTIIPIISNYVFLTLSILGTTYKILMEFYYQATLGKKAFSIKVVNENHAPISLKQAALRSAPWIVITLIELIAFIIPYGPSKMIETSFLVSFSLGFVIMTILIFCLLFSFVCVAYSKFKRGLHDDLANTYCILSIRKKIELN